MYNHRRRYKEKLLNKFARTGPGKELFARTGRSLVGKQWVFILGCYNSGTTLLQRLMLSHPGIAGMPAEGVSYTDVIFRPEEFGWTRMWCECREKIRLNSNYTLAGAERVKSQWSWMLDKPDVDTLLEKSIVNVLHAGFLNEFFNKPKFIHLVRNGYAVSEGIQRKAIPSRWGNPEFSDKYPISLCAKQWSESLREVDSLRGNLFDIYEVTYEQLCEAPNKYLNEIYRFINVDTTSQAVTEQEWLVHGKLASIKNMNCQSIANLSQDELEEIYNTSSHFLKRYGY